MRVNLIINYLKRFGVAMVVEYRESVEMLCLIVRHLWKPLSPEESLRVRRQALDLLKILPFLIVLIAPGKIIVLPVMLRLLPRSAYPSAFLELG